MPGVKLGIPTARGPRSEGRSGSPAARYMSRVAAAGAVSRASRAKTSPSGVRISAKAPPPSPAEKGWVTATAKAVATAASTALPPAARIEAPAWAAREEELTTMPPSATTGARAAPWAPPTERKTTHSAAAPRFSPRSIRPGQGRTWTLRMRKTLNFLDPRAD